MVFWIESKLLVELMPHPFYVFQVAIESSLVLNLLGLSVRGSDLVFDRSSELIPHRNLWRQNYELRSHVNDTLVFLGVDVAHIERVLVFLVLGSWFPAQA